MTRQDFIDQWRHEFGGLVFDALTMGLHGPQASLWQRGVLRKIDLALGQMYDALTRPEPAQNGQATLPLRKP